MLRKYYWCYISNLSLAPIDTLDGRPLAPLPQRGSPLALGSRGPLGGSPLPPLGKGLKESAPGAFPTVPSVRSADGALVTPAPARYS